MWNSIFFSLPIPNKFICFAQYCYQNLLLYKRSSHLKSLCLVWMGSERRREEKKKALMTLFNSITQVENDCNVKSTNGFNGNIFFFFLASVKQLWERVKCTESRERLCLTPPIFQQQYQLVVISPVFPSRLFYQQNPCCEMIVDGK